MKRILVVEDESNIAMGLQDDLQLEGYEVHVASDGLTAIRQALSEPYDVILLDIMLPGKEGFDVCRELRHARLQIPIILLTAKTQESDKVSGLELGADDYVTKPFSPRELRARIKAVLRRSAANQPEVHSFGDVEVDVGRQQVRRGAELIPLTPIEFKLLTTLIHHRGRVLSRNELLDEVWGRDSFVTDRVIDTHIVNLRKKVEDNPSEPRFVVAVRGTGYRFDG